MLANTVQSQIQRACRKHEKSLRSDFSYLIKNKIYFNLILSENFYLKTKPKPVYTQYNINLAMNSHLLKHFNLFKVLE